MADGNMFDALNQLGSEDLVIEEEKKEKKKKKVSMEVKLEEPERVEPKAEEPAPLPSAPVEVESVKPITPEPQQPQKPQQPQQSQPKYIIPPILGAPKPNRVKQWVHKVTGYSSQYNVGQWEANNVCGKPIVYPRYGDIQGAWAHGRPAGIEFIQIEYETPVFVDTIEIYETYCCGAVVKVSADPWLGAKSAGIWEEIWSLPGPDVALMKACSESRIFTIKPYQVSKTPMLQRVLTKHLRIELDARETPGYSEIDAVRLVGWSRVDELPRLPNELPRLAGEWFRLLETGSFSDLTIAATWSKRGLRQKLQDVMKSQEKVALERDRILAEVDGGSGSGSGAAAAAAAAAAAGGASCVSVKKGIAQENPLEEILDKDSSEVNVDIDSIRREVYKPIAQSTFASNQFFVGEDEEDLETDYFPAHRLVLQCRAPALAKLFYFPPQASKDQLFSTGDNTSVSSMIRQAQNIQWQQHSGHLRRQNLNDDAGSSSQAPDPLRISSSLVPVDEEELPNEGIQVVPDRGGSSSGSSFPRIKKSKNDDAGCSSSSSLREREEEREEEEEAAIKADPEYWSQVLQGDPESDTLELRVQDPETVADLLCYIYTLQVEFQRERMLELSQLARKFRLVDLHTKLMRMLKKHCLHDGNVEAVHEYAQAMGDRVLVEITKKMIANLNEKREKLRLEALKQNPPPKEKRRKHSARHQKKRNKKHAKDNNPVRGNFRLRN